eukprot:Nitzschia sp. Nitz4//scaffold18_size181773//43016//44521//NITZ4_001902-RA/size181773-processed-gene-0.192-mRNA-1//1//CDS//3329539972//2843//frame0
MTTTQSNITEILSNEKNEDPTWWLEQLKGIALTVSGKDVTDKMQPSEQKPKARQSKSSSKSTNSHRARISRQGFSLLDNVEGDDNKLDQELISKIRGGIEFLQGPNGQGLPATFVFLFDETWQLAQQSNRILEASCHPKNQFHLDLLAWCIGPGDSGFSPHRDRQPVDAPASFHHASGSDSALEEEPKFVTHWVALSEATPQNSCLYMIPKPLDPGYVTGDVDDDKDPLQRALPDKTCYQQIQALPRKTGQSLLFSHRIIHWGSHNSTTLDSSQPSSSRMAISFVSSDPDFEEPLLRSSTWDVSTLDSTLPPFWVRLLIICAQLIIYHQRFDAVMSTSAIQACYKYVKKYQEHLGDAYRQRVMVEYVKAVQETTAVAGGSGSGSKNEDDKKEPKPAAQQDNDHDDNEEEDDEDAQEAMMEEMLEAEEGGYGEFDDDFDQVMDGEDDDDEDDEDGTDGEPEDNVDDDEEEEVQLFGKRALEDPDTEVSKRVKTMLSQTKQEE